MKDYPRAVQAALNGLHVLRELTADNANQQQRLDELEVLTELRLGHLRQAIELRRGGASTASKLVATGKGLELMNKIQAVAEQMINEEDLLLKQRTAALSLNRRRTNGTILIGILFKQEPQFSQHITLPLGKRECMAKFRLTMFHLFSELSLDLHHRSIVV